MILHTYGTLVKEAGEGDTVTWVLPCDLEAGIPGKSARVPGEGLLCYFSRIIAEEIIGLNGSDAFAVTTAGFVQPSVGSTVVVPVTTVEPFTVGQYVWGSSGFYTISAIGTLTLTLKNLYAPPSNLSASVAVSSGMKIVPSGAAETSGPQGARGPIGPQGVKGDKGDKGDDGDMGPTGAQGPAGNEAQRFWTFNEPGSNLWLCPTGVTQVRVRVYAAGGGGGGGQDGTVHVGYGAGGGEYAEGIVPVTAGSYYSCVIGAGGVGGAGGGSGAAGSDGGLSQFWDGVATIFLKAQGGFGGGNPVSGAVGVGGSFGSGPSGGVITATFRYAGLDGFTSFGGHCGRDGTGGFYNGTIGTFGGSPGGAGGGGKTDTVGGPGGNGANGRIVVEITG